MVVLLVRAGQWSSYLIIFRELYEFFGCLEFVCESNPLGLLRADIYFLAVNLVFCFVECHSFLARFNALTHDEPYNKATDADTLKKLNPSETVDVQVECSHH